MTHPLLHVHDLSNHIYILLLLPPTRGLSAEKLEANGTTLLRVMCFKKKPSTQIIAYKSNFE